MLRDTVSKPWVLIRRSANLCRMCMGVCKSSTVKIVGPEVSCGAGWWWFGSGHVQPAPMFTSKRWCPTARDPVTLCVSIPRTDSKRLMTCPFRPFSPGRGYLITRARFWCPRILAIWWTVFARLPLIPSQLLLRPPTYSPLLRFDTHLSFCMCSPDRTLNDAGEQISLRARRNRVSTSPATPCDPAVAARVDRCLSFERSR